MLSRLCSLDAIDAPFALGERVIPPPAVAAVAPKAVADWTRATIADILTDAERGALAEAFPVPKCIAKPAVDMHDSAPARVDLSSATDPELRAVSERMAAAPRQMREWIRKTYGIGIGLATTEAPVVKADAEGWIAHDGRGCPVAGDTRVLVQCRWEANLSRPSGDGASAKAYGRSVESSHDWWTHRGNHMDIVAYRLVSQGEGA